jgi:signal transduction histidine kinase
VKGNLGAAMNNDLSHVKDPARLAALRAVALLDTPTEEAFDRLSRLAVAFADAPIALVTLVDAERQFFKSCIGLPEPWGSSRETPLSHSFCQYNHIPDRPLLIEDARTHPLFKNNPAIVELGVVAYLGIPLVTSEGYVLGAFCVIDSKPRKWAEKEIMVIRDLAASVMTEINLRTEIAAHKLSEDKRRDLMELINLLRRDVASHEQNEEQIRTLNTVLEQKVEQRTIQLKEKQAQILHSEKLASIGQLSASIAHEFNNPLQGIITVLKGFEKWLNLDEEDSVLLNLAISECMRMKGLIRSLQDFNRPSSGKKCYFHLSSTIESLLLLQKSNFKRKGISVESSYDERAAMVFAIQDQIKQVILNLFTNAVDACPPEGGIISVKTWSDGERIALSIRDNGTGIEKDQLSHIFQPFYSTKPDKKGTGLGLSICHGIVQEHGGEIQVESELGKGSTFTVLLPINTG